MKGNSGKRVIVYWNLDGTIGRYVAIEGRVYQPEIILIDNLSRDKRSTVICEVARENKARDSRHFEKRRLGKECMEKERESYYSAKVLIVL